MTTGGHQPHSEATPIPAVRVELETQVSRTALANEHSAMILERMAVLLWVVVIEALVGTRRAEGTDCLTIVESGRLCAAGVSWPEWLSSGQVPPAG